MGWSDFSFLHKCLMLIELWLSELVVVITSFTVRSAVHNFLPCCSFNIVIYLWDCLYFSYTYFHFPVYKWGYSLVRLLDYHNIGSVSFPIIFTLKLVHFIVDWLLRTGFQINGTIKLVICNWWLICWHYGYTDVLLQEIYYD